KRGHFDADPQLRRRVWRLVGAAVAMGAVMFFLNDLFTPYTSGTWTIRTTAMLILVGAGCVVYAVACFATGAFRPSDIKSLVRRKAT
ncbi:MAG: polysaccharide biosynthesis C-terminal domain-containing protein, partial [Erythrobacter sp.]